MTTTTPLEARSAILLETLKGLTEMIRLEVACDARLAASPAWQRALALADAVIANRPVQ